MRGIAIPYDFTTVLPLPPLKGGPARANGVSLHHMISQVFVFLPPFQGGPARASGVSLHHMISQVRCSSHHVHPRTPKEAL